MPQSNLRNAIGCLQVIVKYLNLCEDERNYNQFHVNDLDMKKFVRLDNAAINALLVFPKLDDSQSNKYDSIFGVLNVCVTVQGKRLLHSWLKQPLRDLNLISERLEVVETFLNDSETRNILSSTLINFPDLIMLSKKLSSKKAKLKDCYKIYQAVDSIPALIKALSRTNNKYIKAMLENPLSDLCQDFKNYQAMIEQTLDMELVDKGDFFVKPTFDSQLAGMHTSD